jgi:hypothetical protein
MKAISKALKIIGVLTSLGAVAWWDIFFSSLFDQLKSAANQAGPSLTEAIPCLYSTGGDCAIARGITTLAGKQPYEPLVLWIGLGALALGVILGIFSPSDKIQVQR